MPVLITLSEDGPLGPAGTEVWVDDPADAVAAGHLAAEKAASKPAPRKASSR